MQIRVLLFFLLTCFSLEADYIVFLVNARGLDTTNTQLFLRTVAKHPSDYSKNGDVGHAWIYLKSDTILEGGHSGELGIFQPKYMEGVMDNVALGAKNPISYLWCHQIDGFFQKGNGGHLPSFAAKVDLTPEETKTILAFIHSYPFNDYSLQGHQCSSFVSDIGKLIGIDLSDKVTLPIDQQIILDGKPVTLWTDSKYSSLTFSSPDQLQVSLKALVKSGNAEDVTRWYLRNHRICPLCLCNRGLQNLFCLKDRLSRIRSLKSGAVK